MPSLLRPSTGLDAIRGVVNEEAGSMLDARSSMLVAETGEAPRVRLSELSDPRGEKAVGS